MLDILKSRRSIRKYQNKEVEQEKIDAIIKAALLAPSSRNIRPWEFIVVTDKKILEELSKCKEHGSHFLEGAPLGIVVLADSQKSDVWVEDVSIASVIIQLQTQSLGLGSCWIQIRERMHNGYKTADEYIRELMTIPSNMRVECIISIGYADEQKQPNSEEQLKYDKVHFNSFNI